MIVKAWCKSECSLTKSSKPGTPVLPSPIATTVFPSLTATGKESLLWRTHVIILGSPIIQDNLITLGSPSLISSAKFLCPAKQDIHRFWGLKTWMFWEGALFCLLQNMNKKRATLNPFLGSFPCPPVGDDMKPWCSSYLDQVFLQKTRCHKVLSLGSGARGPELKI